MFSIDGRNYVTEVERNSDGIKVIRKIPKKYDLIYDRIESIRQGKKLYRIRARRDFQRGGVTVNKGDFGGLIENRWNLSHEGNCWIDYDSTVYGQMYIIDNAYIGGKSKIYSSRASYIGKETLIKDSNVSTNNGIIAIFVDTGSIRKSRICVRDSDISIGGNISITDTVLTASVEANIVCVDNFSINNANIHLSHSYEASIFNGVTISDSKFDSFESGYRKGIIITNTHRIDGKNVSIHTDGVIKINKKVFSLSKEKNTFEIR